MGIAASLRRVVLRRVSVHVSLRLVRVSCRLWLVCEPVVVIRTAESVRGLGVRWATCNARGWIKRCKLRRYASVCGPRSRLRIEGLLIVIVVGLAASWRLRIARLRIVRMPRRGMLAWRIASAWLVRL